MTVNDGDIVKAVVDFAGSDGNHFQNVFHWVAAFAAGQTEAAVLAAILTMLGNMYDELASQIPSDLEDPDVEVDVVEWDTDHWETVARVGEGIAGTTFSATTELLPYTTCAYWVARTARPRSRGRKFMPPFVESQNNAGWLVSGAQTALAAALTDALADITISSGNTLTPGVASDATGTFLPFLNGFISGLFGTQRRRKQGYGI
jgi:hypothetical protein